MHLTFRCWKKVSSNFNKQIKIVLSFVSIVLDLLVRPLIALVIFGWCAPMVFLGTNRYCFTNAISCVSSIIALFSNSGIEQRLNLYLFAIVVILRGLILRIQNSKEFVMSVVQIFCWNIAWITCCQAKLKLYGFSRDKASKK